MVLSKLNEMIDYYNWDDGFEFPKKVLEYPECDLALALKIFYLGDGFAYFQILQNNISEKKEWLQFISTLYHDIVSGRYLKSNINYCIPLTKVQKYQFKKISIPEVFIEDI